MMQDVHSSEKHPTITEIAKGLAPGAIVFGSLGYARLQGCGRGALDYKVRRKHITLGRLGGGADCQMRSSSRKIGRKHALIEWDTKKKRWVITCLSKKGALVVDGVPVVVGAPRTVLTSRSLIEMGDTFFFFLLPRATVARTKDLSLFEQHVQEERVELRRRAEQRLKAAKRIEENKKRFSIKIKVPKKRPKPTAPKARVSEGRDAKRGTKSGHDAAPKPAVKDEYKKEWTKKEKADFLRAINAVGVDKRPSSGDGVQPGFDWSKFRSVSALPRKSDEILTDYYVRWIADVEEVLAKEELEKRTKGPRTKHKAGCDCIVCENTRKSRRKLMEANGEGSAEEEQDANGPKPERLVGLVTAQKFKKRMAILDAAANIDSAAGESVIAKLTAQPAGSGAGGELPIWWENGKHDRAMMIGCRRYGVGQWKTLWASDLFADVREDSSGENVWPSEKTAMKRLREVASAVNTIIRREQKRLKRNLELEAQGLPVKKRKTTPKKKKELKEENAAMDDTAQPTNGDGEERKNNEDGGEDDAEENEDDKNLVEYYVEEVDESGAETEDEDESDAVVVEEETVEVTEDDDDEDDDLD
eukprot:Plantae.Rhodophyta-Hildenbrandia_rubra.ctg7135.p2 GENE.Plantae.Rhodophyta-Hildenbrandia_rubra.ctg7135~~Plantae.Rhodophyta-Hildenbrandia_rubra.ctg7135.p2  ORF type:complete len:587 (-),score=142.80 Plantae.Rhodophyta-Hildenbrandia_rubra.ctg7135:3880-5640(-)